MPSPAVGLNKIRKVFVKFCGGKLVKMAKNSSKGIVKLDLGIMSLFQENFRSIKLLNFCLLISEVQYCPSL